MKYIFCWLFVGLLLWGCEAEPQIDVLEISYESLTFEEVVIAGAPELRAVLVFSFLDGNGKIGARDGADSESRIFYVWEGKKENDADFETLEIEVDIFDDDGERIGTELIPYEGSTAIPYSTVMDKDAANNKTLKGKIEIALMTPQSPVNVPDIARIGFLIKDRDGKPSITKGTLRNLNDEPPPPPTFTPEIPVIRLPNGGISFENPQ